MKEKHYASGKKKGVDFRWHKMNCGFYGKCGGVCLKMFFSEGGSTKNKVDDTKNVCEMAKQLTSYCHEFYKTIKKGLSQRDNSMK